MKISSFPCPSYTLRLKASLVWSSNLSTLTPSTLIAWASSSFLEDVEVEVVSSGNRAREKMVCFFHRDSKIEIEVLDHPSFWFSIPLELGGCVLFYRKILLFEVIKFKKNILPIVVRNMFLLKFPLPFLPY